MCLFHQFQSLSYQEKRNDDDTISDYSILLLYSNLVMRYLHKSAYNLFTNWIKTKNSEGVLQNTSVLLWIWNFWILEKSSSSTRMARLTRQMKPYVTISIECKWIRLFSIIRWRHEKKFSEVNKLKTVVLPPNVRNLRKQSWIGFTSCNQYLRGWILQTWE